MTKASYDYDYDAMGQRTSVIQSGELFARYANGGGLMTQWTYNDRGEVTAATSYHGTNPADLSYPIAGRNFTYAYDNAGNRTSASVDSQSTGYTSNSLNQITARTTPGKVPVSGLAPTNSTVSVSVNGGSGQAPVRQGEYFFKNVDVTNTSGPANAGISVSSTGASSVSRNWFVPKASLGSGEEWTYDADGNLTQDDKWQYTWDGENRLIGMQTKSSLLFSVVSATDSRKLTFTYDYLGRRVEKEVRNGTSFGTVLSDTRFIYQGWNLVAEYNAISTLSLIRSYTWGLDLSGSQSGAGGIGGLLAIYDAGTSTSYGTAYDGNGNLTALIKRSDGSVAAAYEYSPFGELLRSNGTYAQANPFRFSTKYTDDETGLVYYGMRYYDPVNGRFVGRDPIEEAGGRNLYAFCGNNGVGGWDFIGMIDPIDPNKLRWEENLMNAIMYGIQSYFGGMMPSGFDGNYSASQLFNWAIQAGVPLSYLPTDLVYGNGDDSPPVTTTTTPTNNPPVVIVDPRTDTTSGPPLVPVRNPVVGGSSTSVDRDPDIKEQKIVEVTDAGTTTTTITTTTIVTVTTHVFTLDGNWAGQITTMSSSSTQTTTSVFTPKTTEPPPPPPPVAPPGPTVVAATPTRANPTLLGSSNAPNWGGFDEMGLPIGGYGEERQMAVVKGIGDFFGGNDLIKGTSEVSNGRIAIGAASLAMAGMAILPLDGPLGPLLGQLGKVLGLGSKGIQIADKELIHILARHTARGAEAIGTSIFNEGEDILRLVRNAESLSPVKQAVGPNFERIVDAGRIIGVDRATNKATSIYSVITDAKGNLVTSFPGLPGRR